MHTFIRVAAQGDVYIKRLDDDEEIPAAQEQAPTDGRHVVAHSEQGHDHHIDAAATRFFLADAFTSYLEVLEETPLIHDRSVDGHAPILMRPGKYRLRRQRQPTLTGYQLVED